MSPETDRFVTSPKSTGRQMNFDIGNSVPLVGNHLETANPKPMSGIHEAASPIQFKEDPVEA